MLRQTRRRDARLILRPTTGIPSEYQILADKRALIMAEFVPHGVQPSDTHILSPKQWPGVQTLTKQWHFCLDLDETGSHGRQQAPQKLMLRHCQATGNWVLICNGKSITSGGEPILNRTFDIPFNLLNKRCVIFADGVNSFYYQHQLVIEGQPEESVRNKIEMSIGESLPVSIGIPSTRTYREMAKVVVVYQVEVKLANGKELLLDRRYSDFSQLDACIRSATEGHMYSSLPALPGKCYNPWVDQNSDAFIFERRVGLENYLRMLLGNSKVAYFTDYLVFLGLDPLSGNADTSPTMMFNYPKN